MPAHSSLQVTVITESEKVYEGTASMVIAPGTEGQLGILPRHAHLLTTLAVGELRIKHQGTEDALFVAGGFMEVRPDSVMVLTESAIHAEDIDEAEAQKARERAEHLLAQRSEDVDQAHVSAELQKAVGKIKVAELHRRRGGRKRAPQPPHTEP